MRARMDALSMRGRRWSKKENGCSVYARKNGCSVNARKKKRNMRKEEDGCSVYEEEANGGSAVSV